MDGNKSNFSQTNNHVKKQANPRLGTLFIILIIAQFYLMPLLGLATGQDPTSFRDYVYLYIIPLYSIIVLGIIIFHDNGLDVLQDHYSLWIVVVACFLAASPRNTNAIYRVFLVLLGLRLAVHIIINRKGIKTPDLKSVLIGLLWSVSTIVILALILAFLDPIRESLPPNLSVYILTTSQFEVSFVTVIEEASFRGLLFGLLVMKGYQENKALFIQAILFWGIHYLKSPDLLLFFVATPLLTLSVTLIIKKYKMLYLSVMIHTVANVFLTILVAVLQNAAL